MSFQPVIHYRSLHSRVLVVAQTRIEGTWKAYCSDVPGQSHFRERDIALESGDTVPEDIARVMFPEFAKLPYAR